MIKHLKRFIILCFVLLYIDNQVFAQGRVSGIITEKGSGATLPGATVKVRESSEATVSDTDGRFSIRAEAGQELVITYLGYLSKQITLQEGERNLNIILE